MSGSAGGVICLSCSIFKPLLDRYEAQGLFSAPVQYIDSMLHMNPGLLGTTLSPRIDALLQAGNHVLLIYGDCHARMSQQHQHPGVSRVPGANCPELILGSVLYRQFRREGVFFLMREWVERWQEVFEIRLGLHGATARDFMREMHTRMLYLDLEDGPVPISTLEALSAHTGLPFTTHIVDPAPLREAIGKCIREMKP